MKPEQREQTIEKVLGHLTEGVSIKDACLKAGTKYSTFWKWRQEDSEERTAAPEDTPAQGKSIDERIMDAKEEAGLRRLMDEASEVEKALILRAKGFKQVEEEFIPETDKDGNIVYEDGDGNIVSAKSGVPRGAKPRLILKKRKEKTIAPSVTAIALALVNMAKSKLTTIEWKNVWDVALDDETKEDLMALFRRLAVEDREKEADEPPAKCDKKKGELGTEASSKVIRRKRVEEIL